VDRVARLSINAALQISSAILVFSHSLGRELPFAAYPLERQVLGDQSGKP
jgi:hypothetical protein